MKPWPKIVESVVGIPKEDGELGQLCLLFLSGAIELVGLGLEVIIVSFDVIRGSP
jgi:hypothetical protein